MGSDSMHLKTLPLSFAFARFLRRGRGGAPQERLLRGDLRGHAPAGLRGGENRGEGWVGGWPCVWIIIIIIVIIDIIIILSYLYIYLFFMFCSYVC